MSEKAVELIKHLNTKISEIKKELKKKIIGQEAVIEQFLIAIFSNGHSMIEGVPGLAKTRLISALSEVFDLHFSRIQFTPDLMPSDITGTEILTENEKTKKKEFQYIRGPIFANIVLADEINRTPPKTQAALLQAMQEKEVTAGNQTWKLDAPFFVFATQNPIEQEGTYPLPEAQLDRFMFKIKIDYPSVEEERDIVKLTTTEENAAIKPIMNAKEIIEMQQAIRQMPVTDHVIDYAVALVRATRPHTENAHELAKKWITWGAGPRASQYLITGAKTRAALQGRFTPAEEDVAIIAPIVLRHRVLVSFAAEAEGRTAESLVKELTKILKKT